MKNSGSMDTINESRELDQMRKQISILREKLETQKIVNERHVRTAIRSGVSWLNRQGKVMMAMGIMALPLCTLSFYKMGISLWFCCATAVMLGFCVAKTWMHHRALWATGLPSDDLVTVGERVMKLRRDYIDWLKVGIPMLLIWFGWFALECYAKMDNDVFRGFFTGGCAGLLIGLALGLKIHRKTVRRAETVLDQIEELRNCQ